MKKILLTQFDKYGNKIGYEEYDDDMIANENLKMYLDKKCDFKLTVVYEDS